MLNSAEERRKVCDLATKFIEQGRDSEANPTLLFNALSMAFLSFYIVCRVQEGYDVEEADLARAIGKFTDTMAAQAGYLLNFQPELLKSEK